MLEIDKFRRRNAPRVVAMAKFFTNLRLLEFKHKVYSPAEAMKSRGDQHRCLKKRRKKA